MAPGHAASALSMGTSMQAPETSHVPSTSPPHGMSVGHAPVVSTVIGTHAGSPSAPASAKGLLASDAAVASGNDEASGEEPASIDASAVEPALSGCAALSFEPLSVGLVVLPHAAQSSAHARIIGVFIERRIRDRRAGRSFEEAVKTLRTTQ